MLAGVHGGPRGGAGTASLGMLGGMSYAQQPVPSLPMQHPALPELSTLISQFETAAISNAGFSTPALLMQACPSAPLCWIHGQRISAVSQLKAQTLTCRWLTDALVWFILRRSDVDDEHRAII